MEPDFDKRYGKWEVQTSHLSPHKHRTPRLALGRGSKTVLACENNFLFHYVMELD